jgi:universal stress protein E
MHPPGRVELRPKEIEMTKLELGTVLVASDLSEGGEEIVRSAAALALVAGADLRVLHVLELDAAPYMEMAGLDASFPGRIERAERQLEEQIERIAGNRVPATGKVVIDTVHRALLAEAESVGADVIVLGPHRKRPVVDGLLGSTADRVIRNSRIPSLVLREALTLTLPLRRVVTPLDMSEPGRAAVSVAAAWLRALGEGGELCVVHVVPHVFTDDELSIDITPIRAAMHEQVSRAVGGAEAGISVRDEVIRGERVADEIVRYATDQRADLVVLATHGQGAFKRHLIGSVAADVLRHASGPVLLVPPAMWREDD